MLTSRVSLNNINNKVRGSGTKTKNSKFISQHQTIIWRSTLKRKLKILDLEAEVRSVKSRYVSVLKSSNDEIRLLESSQREADEIIAGRRGALESKSIELDSLRMKYTNLRADHEHESDLFTQEREDLLCLLESEGIDNLASLDSLDSLLE